MPDEPLQHHKFAGRERVTLDAYSGTQQAILPVIGIRCDGTIEGLGTAFCVCNDPVVLVTAKHVVERFIEDNRQDLATGAASIQVVWETDEKNPDNITDLGAPIPVYRAVYYTASTVQREHEWLGPPDDDEKGFNSDLALLLPFGVLSGDTAVGPTPVQPLGFDLPARDAWAYSFGYPEMAGEIGTTVGGERVVDWSRSFDTSAGHVTQTYPDGQPGNTLVQGPSFEMDVELPHGMSGGAVLVDDLGICAVASAAIDPEKTEDQWTAYATGLAPILELPTVDRRDGQGTLSVRDLIDLGAISTPHNLPAVPGEAPPVTVVTFPLPAPPDDGPATN